MDAVSSPVFPTRERSLFLLSTKMRLCALAVNSPSLADRIEVGFRFGSI